MDYFFVDKPGHAAHSRYIIIRHPFPAQDYAFLFEIGNKFQDL